MLERIAEHARAIAYLLAALTALGGFLVARRAGDAPRSLDEPAFYDVARNLVDAGSFAHTNPASGPRHSDRFPVGAPVPTAYEAPGYPFWLAALAAAGAGQGGMRAANFLLLALTLVVLFHLVSAHGSPLGGLLAVLGALAYPVVLYAAGTLYPQTLASLLLVLTVFIASRLRRDAGVRRFVLLGLCAGAMALVAPRLLLIIPMIIVWVLATRRGKLPQVALSAVLAATVVGAWTIRNVMVFERLVPITTSLGFNLASGNCAAARYNTSVDVRLPDRVYEDLTGKDEVDADQVLTRAALDWARAHPGRAGLLYAGKFLHWFAPSNRLLSDGSLPGGASAVPRRVRDFLLLLAYGTLLLLLVLRLSLARHLPLTDLELLCGALYLAAGLAYALTFTRVRFRLPVDWLLIAVDAGCVATLLEGARAAGVRTGAERTSARSSRRMLPPPAPTAETT
jgi:hypothetical protein